MMAARSGSMGSSRHLCQLTSDDAEIDRISQAAKCTDDECRHIEIGVKLLLEYLLVPTRVPSVMGDAAKPQQ